MSQERVELPTSRYRAVRRIGVGAHGEVWLATGPRGRAALKVPTGPRAQARVLREAEILASLDHPHVVRHIEHAPDGSWLAMEHLPGGDAARWARGRTLDDIVALLTAVAEGLAHMHERGFVHGDIKPGNVLIDSAGTARLIDMGIAADTQDTPGGGFRGTLGYASPEQMRGEALTPASDLYALGALSYQLVTGKLPFRGEDPAALAWLPLKTLPEPPSSHRPRMPQQLDQLILRMLARRPEARPPGAGVLAATLGACMFGTAGSPVIGMHREREALRRMVVEAEDGRTAVAILHGPRGSGRATLIREALAAARREGLAVVRAPVGPTRWQDLFDELAARPSAIALDGDTAWTTPLMLRLISRKVPCLALARASQPIAPLLSLGARHISPPRLGAAEVGTLLDLADADRRTAEAVLRNTQGLPGAIVGDLQGPALPEDLGELEHALLQATSNGPVGVFELAERFDLGAHALLDQAERLLDRGLLTEVQDGAALERAGR